MYTNEDEKKFLLIDSLEERVQEYYEIVKDGKYAHTILFHGDTGCGKLMFSEYCSKIALEKNEDIIVIDLTQQLKASKHDSDGKLREILHLIEFDLVQRLGFEDLKGKYENTEIFKRAFEKILRDTNNILLIRFPKIEVFQEFEKYYSYLFNGNTILYFIAEQKMVVEECKKNYEQQISYFECKRLKSGDGKLYIESKFPTGEEPVFAIEDIEEWMERRPPDGKMTIKELESLCRNAYTYAQKNKIDTITKAVIIDDLVSRSII